MSVTAKITAKITALEDYDLICRDLIAKYPRGIAVLLSGVLGAGKTTFVKRFALAIGENEAASPTYGLMHEYSPNFRHIDLYRSGFNDLLARGIFERVLEEGWTFIEWADQETKNYLKNNDLESINIEIEVENNDRILSVSNG